MNNHINESIRRQSDVMIEVLDETLNHGEKQNNYLGLHVFYVTPSVSSNFADSSTSSHSDKTSNKVDKVKWLEKQLGEANKKLELANKIIFKNNQNHNLLKKRLKRLTTMQRNATVVNDQCLKSVLKKLFNDDQIKVLTKQSRRGHL